MELEAANAQKKYHSKKSKHKEEDTTSQWKVDPDSPTILLRSFLSDVARQSAEHLRQNQIRDRRKDADKWSTSFPNRPLYTTFLP